MAAFGRRFLTEDFAMMKKKGNVESLTSELERFMQVKTTMDEARTVYKSLLRMHSGFQA